GEDLLAACEADDAEALRLEQVPQHLPGGWLVIHHEDGRGLRVRPRLRAGGIRQGRRTVLAPVRCWPLPWVAPRAGHVSSVYRRAVRPQEGLLLLEQRSGEQDLPSELDHRGVLVLTGLLEEAVRLAFAEAARLHEQSLGAFDELALFELELELVALPPGIEPLVEAGAGDGDRRREVVRVHRLHQVMEDRRAGRLLDRPLVAVRGQDDDGDRPLGRDLLRGFRSRHSWHADVEERDVGLAFAR